MVEPLKIPDFIIEHPNLSEEDRQSLKVEEFKKLIAAVKLKCRQKISSIDIKKFLAKKLLLPEPMIKQRCHMVQQLENALCSQGFSCKLQIFGSIGCGLAFKDKSDIDIFVRVPDIRFDRQPLKYRAENFENIRNKFRSMRSIFRTHEDTLFPYNVFIETLLQRKMRVPLLRLTIFSDIWECNQYLELIRLSIKCDLNVNCALGLANTRLIRFLCQLDARFMSIVLLVRLWLRNIVRERILLSSYAATLLVLFYFQQKSILPAIDYLIKLSRSPYPLYTNTCRTDFCTNIDIVTQHFPHDICDENVAQLFIGFFKFYSQFDFNSNFICTHTAKIVPKNYPSDVVEVYDPFDMTHNVTGRVNIEGMVREFIDGYESYKN
ncbi:uncharacterized protein LOC124491838 isoform X1 [Dermatophagoides farinae]|uniref:uncharacterized protein LOC124491838 isoform X1 n=1 Tax=Dermatophagoides farinae TaxID=6954 RepID=UPI003F5F56A7